MLAIGMEDGFSMKGLTHQQCAIWVASHMSVAYGGEALDFPTIPFTSAKVSGGLPADSGRKVWLANVVFRELQSESEILLWVRNWTVWPSSCHVPLIQRLREALGEHRALEEAPGNLITSSEASDGISILILALQFCWDCLVVGASGTLAFFTSHDEYFTFMALDE